MTKALQIALILTALDRASAPVKRVSNAVGEIGKVVDRVSRNFNSRFEQMGKKAGEVAARIKKSTDDMRPSATGAAVFGAGAMAAVNAPLKAFEELEDASTRMRLAYSDAQGQQSAYFRSILKQTGELGNQLPGTNKDFAQLATSLKEAGLAENAIANGGLKAAGYLRTIFDEHDSKKVAEVVAGSLHAFNLADDSLIKYIDIMQRAHYAFGMTLEDFKYGLPYIARSYGLLNPKGGLQAARNQTIMMGMLRQGGMEGSMIGESIGSFYTQLATRGSRLEFGLNRLGLMTRAGEYLKKYHTDLTVFDKKGSYVGDEALVRQIWRLKQLGATAQEISLIGNSLAGATGSTILTKLYQQGPEGWDKAEERLRNQLDLYKKIEILLKTLKNIKEAAMGTVTNLGAVIGGALAPAMKTQLDTLNDLTSKLQVYFTEQQKGNTIIWFLTQLTLKAVVALAALAIAYSIATWSGIGLGKGLRVLMLLFQGLTKAVVFFRATQTVGMFGEIITGAAPAILMLGKLKAGYVAVTMVTRAFLVANAALLAPLAAVLAVVAALYQLWKHWDTLKQPGFLKDLKGWVGSGFGMLTDPEKEEARRTREWQQTEAERRRVSRLAYPANTGSIHFSPQITIQGNADKGHVAQALATSQRDFERMHGRMQAQKERRAF